MQHQERGGQDLLKVAIAAAGGAQAAADKLGKSLRIIYYWIAQQRMPLEFIRPLCQAGNNTITPQALTEYLVAAAEERAQKQYSEDPAEATHGG